MSYFNKRTSSGVFVQSAGKYIEYKGELGDGSINGITQSLGYHPDQLYSPRIPFGPKEPIIGIFYEIFSRNIAFILCDRKLTFITEKDIKKYLGDFSVRKHFTGLEITNTLTDGVDHNSLSVGFLAKVLSLKNTSRNGVFYSEKISSYLYFTDGLLSDFQFNDGLFHWAKHLQAVNPTVYNWIAETAHRYWSEDDFQAKREINIQCEAWSCIPNAFGNEFLNLHRTENGGANLHMIRVCHYDYPINLNQFKEINHRRYIVVTQDVDSNYTVLRCGLFLYLFDLNSGELLKIEQVQI